jgi:hypothetical protein
MPVLERSVGLDRSYHRLPVLFVDDFAVITPQLLRQVREREEARGEQRRKGGGGKMERDQGGEWETREEREMGGKWRQELDRSRRNGNEMEGRVRKSKIGVAAGRDGYCEGGRERERGRERVLSEG